MKKKTPFRKITWIAAGILCLIIGTIGIFVPVLPSTVFFLMAAAAFAHGSSRLYRWIMNHRFFGALIRNYRLYHAIPVQTKIVSVFFLWLMIGTSAVFAVTQWWLRGLLFLIAVGVTWHILAIKTLSPQMASEFLQAEKKREGLLEGGGEFVSSEEQ